MLYNCVTGGGCVVTLTFVFFWHSGWMSWVCYFVPIKRFGQDKMCILMWFVPLRTFCRYGFGREMAEESWEVSDWWRM